MTLSISKPWVSYNIDSIWYQYVSKSYNLFSSVHCCYNHKFGLSH